MSSLIGEPLAATAATRAKAWHDEQPRPAPWQPARPLRRRGRAGARGCLACPSAPGKAMVAAPSGRARAKTNTVRRSLHQLTFALVMTLSAIVFLVVVAHQVYTYDLKPLAAFCLPVVPVFFAFTSLLYMRGRSLAAGKDQVWTLYAAERSMQATVFYLSGVVVGASVYGLLQVLGFAFDPAHPTSAGLWLLLFLAPYVLMQIGFYFFMTAVWTVVPQLLRPVSSKEVWRRIALEPSLQ